MIRSMTGFSSKAQAIMGFGKAEVELRSSNHKFLEVAFRLPEGLLPLEDRLKKEIESRIKRGRIVCALNIAHGNAPTASINRAVLKKYVATFRQLQQELKLSQPLRLEALINLPGVLSCQDKRLSAQDIWPKIRPMFIKAIDDLQRAREKEGSALGNYLNIRQAALSSYVTAIKLRSKSAVKRKLAELTTDEERSMFLKNSDISEEVERLSFHIKNFKSRMHKNNPVGKELDFIAQEMQREANTLGAKTFDTRISAKVIQIKSQIEKIREQAQNIE